jgi:hypothetical protein
VTAKGKRKDTDAAPLLASLAAALNACDKAGLKVKLRHGGVVETEAGFVIRADSGWVARTLEYTEFAGDREGDGGD